MTKITGSKDHTIAKMSVKLVYRIVLVIEINE